MKVKVYLCREEESRAVVPRHHVAPIAVCEELKEVALDELSKDEDLRILVDELVKRGETVVVDRKLFEKLVGFYIENHYLRLKIHR